MIQTLPTPAVTGITPLTPAPVSDRIAHKCDVGGCELPAAYVRHGMLIVESRHHGEKHITIFSIAELYKAYCQTPVAFPLPMMDFYGGAVPTK